MKKMAVLSAVLILPLLVMGQSYSEGYFGGYADIGVGSAPAVEELTYIFVYPGYDTATHNDPEFAAAIAGADSVILLTDADAEFASLQIAKGQPGALMGDINSQLRYRYYNSDTGVSGADYYDITSGNQVPTNDRRISMFHMAWENYIPANSTITKAEFHQMLASSMTATASTVNDSTYLVLMTNPLDNLWYTSIGVTGPWGSLANAANANWDQQIKYAGVSGYPDVGDSTVSTVWNPTLDNRTRFWDYGAVSDSRGYNVSSPAQNTNLNLPLINCVQAAVNGEVNNGVAVIHICKSQVNTAMIPYNWETGSNNTDYEPWVEVKFLNRNYISPMPDSGEVAFVFILDDQKKDLHDVTAPLYRTNGGRFTSTLPGNTVNAYPGNPAIVPIDSLVLYYDQGIAELASQSYWGDNLLLFDTVWPDDPFGSATNYTQGMYPDVLGAGSTALDSLLYTTDPEWMFVEFEDATGYSWRNKPYFAKTFAHPTAQPKAEAQKAIVLQGYKAVRMAISSAALDANGERDYYVTPASTRSDTIRTGLIPQDMLRPQNLTFMGMRYQNSNFDGSSYAEKYYKFRMAFEKAAANKRRVVSFFAHDTTDINEQGIRAALDALGDTRGGVAVSMWDIVNRLKAYSTAVATPTAFSQSDTFKYTIEQDVWGELYGDHGNFVPSLGPQTE